MQTGDPRMQLGKLHTRVARIFACRETVVGRCLFGVATQVMRPLSTLSRRARLGPQNRSGGSHRSRPQGPGASTHDRLLPSVPFTELAARVRQGMPESLALQACSARGRAPASAMGNCAKVAKSYRRSYRLDAMSSSPNAAIASAEMHVDRRAVSTLAQSVGLLEYCTAYFRYASHRQLSYRPRVKVLPIDDSQTR